MSKNFDHLTKGLGTFEMCLHLGTSFCINTRKCHIYVAENGGQVMKTDDKTLVMCRPPNNGQNVMETK